MSYAFVENQHLTDIANAIRAKTGSQDTMKVREMSGNIENIPTGPDLSVITATASDVDTGKIFIDSSGQEVTGTSTYKSDYTALDTDVKGVLNGGASSVTIPSGVTKIKSYLFYSDTSLRTIDIPSSVTSIDSSAFRNCTNLALTSLPSGITGIDQYAFASCTNLALTSLPSGITSIGNYAFRNCTNLALTSLPSGITSIGNYAFRNCTNLALTSLPSGITSIGDSAFSGCTGLTTITFEGTPTTINSNAFGECTNLITINVPWAEGAVAGAPWGATNATINYNYAGE